MKTKPHFFFANGLWWCAPSRGARIAYAAETQIEAWLLLRFERGWA
jgi:hypothetical protein